VWQLALALERPSEERLGGGDVPLGAKQEIDGVSLFVDSAVKTRPTASDFDVGLIDAPGPPSWASEAVPALLELRHIALDPAHDRRMRQGEPAFGHHLGEISKAELVSQIPAHAEHDDLLVKVPALEESVHFRLRSSALSFDRFANDYAVSKQFAPEPLAEGLVGADGFAVDASLIAADANKQRSVPNREWKPEEVKENAIRAAREYLATLDNAAFGAASPVTPKFISRSDPVAQWTGAHKGHAFFAYANNYLIDTDHGVIVDVEATRAIRQAEVGAARTMLERTEMRFGMRPASLAADSAYGSAESLA
jgi:hypothetical protein